MTVIIDNREQKPILFDKASDPDFPGMKILWGTLKTGDYSILGMDTPSCQHSICVERKSLADLFGSVGKGRARFLAEFERMAEFDHAALVIESNLVSMFLHPPPLSYMKPKSVFRTLIAWSQRYNIPIWPCYDKAFAERTTYLLLKRFWDDRQFDGKMEFCKL